MRITAQVTGPPEIALQRASYNRSAVAFCSWADGPRRDLKARVKVTQRRLWIERPRCWSKHEKARIVEERPW